MLIGALCFWLILGSGILDPANIAWLQGRDPSTLYISWSYFRAAPWGWPPTANPDFGIELAATIFFADPVPIMALLLKATIAPADGPWQYYGAWLLICFVLQAFFAHRIAALFVADAPARLLIAAYACFAPVLLWRLSGPHALTGHYGLMAQWLILCAAWLGLRPVARRQGLAWVCLGGLAALVTTYLTAMVLAFWVADVVRRAMQRAPAAALLAEGLAMALTVTGAFWLAGFQQPNGGGLGGYGYGVYRANLLTLLDAQNWSYVFRGFPRGAGDYEGFAFLGTGGIAALVGALWLLRRDARLPRPSAARWPFLAVVFGLALFSLSTTIGLAHLNILTIPLPEPVERLLALFRSSGRMIWPLHYLLLLGSAFVLFRRLGARCGRLALAAVLVLQVADGSAGWLPVAREARNAGPTWTTPMQDPFWQEAGGHYARLRRLPPGNALPGWDALSFFALMHRMPTDALYIARVGAEPLRDLQARGDAMIRSGRFEADTLYALDNASACAAAQTIDASRDLLIRLDGFNVLAPGWLPSRVPPAAGRPIRAAGAPPGARPGLTCGPDAAGRLVPMENRGR